MLQTQPFTHTCHPLKGLKLPDPFVGVGVAELSSCIQLHGSLLKLHRERNMTTTDEGPPPLISDSDEEDDNGKLFSDSDTPQV